MEGISRPHKFVIRLLCFVSIEGNGGKMKDRNKEGGRQRGGNKTKNIRYIL